MKVLSNRLRGILQSVESAALGDCAGRTRACTEMAKCLAKTVTRTAAQLT